MIFFKYRNGVKTFRFDFLFDVYGYFIIFCLAIVWYLVPFGRKFLKWHKEKMNEKRYKKYGRKK